jgi:hypothetical protein
MFGFAAPVYTLAPDIKNQDNTVTIYNFRRMLFSLEHHDVVRNRFYYNLSVI